MNDTELWQLVVEAEAELQAAQAAQSAARAGVDLQRDAELRDLVALAALKLLRIKHRWKSRPNGVGGA